RLVAKLRGPRPSGWVEVTLEPRSKLEARREARRMDDVRDGDVRLPARHRGETGRLIDFSPTTDAVVGEARRLHGGLVVDVAAVEDGPAPHHLRHRRE